MPGWTSRATSERAARGHGRDRRAGGRAWVPTSLLVGVLCATPLLRLAWRAATGRLGIDPLDTLVRSTGWWAMALLLATLSVTPLRQASVQLARIVAVRYGRRLSDWNGLIRHRRQIGLWSFAYAAVHLVIYATLDAGSLAEIGHDLAERPFIAAGMLGFVLLVPLALTSTRSAMRRLKKRWARLHRLVYPAAMLALLHAWMQTKSGHDLPVGFVTLGVLLAAARVAALLGDGQVAGADATDSPQPPPRQA